MKSNGEKIRALIRELEVILLEIKESRDRHQSILSAISDEYKNSAVNLISYLAFRKRDHRKLQQKLGHLGLSRLARAEGHITASIESILQLLHKFIGLPREVPGMARISIKKGDKLLNKRTVDLFGYRSRGRRLRIMVTLPSEAADEEELVDRLVKAGMNCARINCAHDDEAKWLRMIGFVRKASQRHKRNVKIAMDISGPKIRTGEIAEGPRVIKLSPDRNEFGHVIRPAIIKLTTEKYLQHKENNVAIDGEVLEGLMPGDWIVLTDTRKRKRKLLVTEKHHKYVLTECKNTVFLSQGTKCTVGDSEFLIERVMPIEQSIVLNTGDSLLLSGTSRIGCPALYDKKGNLVHPASISCTAPEVLDFVEEGHKVFFDDGKIEGRVSARKEGQVEVTIQQARSGGSKLRADKGINFPDSHYRMSGLTERDKEDLKFIARHADIVNFSFVNTPEDVKELYHELTSLGAMKKLAVIFKIETQLAYNNLADIILEGMGGPSIGIMIARGDLAIETGWNSIGKVQREILSICNAAHVPVVWATQVLENLAKTGIPSRAEITDTVTALKAECIMLNKGPYILKSMKLLNKLTAEMEGFQEKNAPMLPELERI